MATLVCDKCQFEWQATETEFQEIILSEKDGVIMRYFQCPECGEEYIVAVTDNDLRKKVAMLKKMTRKYARMVEARESETKLRNYLHRIDALRGETLVRQCELRARWTRGKSLS